MPALMTHTIHTACTPTAATLAIHSRQPASSECTIVPTPAQFMPNGLPRVTHRCTRFDRLQLLESDQPRSQQPFSRLDFLRTTRAYEQRCSGFPINPDATSPADLPRHLCGHFHRSIAHFTQIAAGERRRTPRNEDSHTTNLLRTSRTGRYHWNDIPARYRCAPGSPPPPTHVPMIRRNFDPNVIVDLLGCRN